jgi:glycosyltransferase involved in cell wall biosynthesis
MPQFLCTNVWHAPNISDDAKWEFVVRKINRDFPWLLTEQHDVLFSGIGQGWCGWRKRGRIESHAGFRSIPFSLYNAALAWLTHFCDALRLIKKESVVVLAPTPLSGLGAVLAKLLVPRRMHLVVRVIGHTASKALYVKRSRLQFKLLEKIERSVLCRADLVLPMGKFTHELTLAYGARPQTVIVLPFPVSWADVAKITGLPAKPAVLFAGRLEREKGVDILLQAMRMVKKSLPNVHLLIAGDGSYRATLESLVDALDLRETVSFLGWLQADALQLAYKDSILLTMPSICEEGLGMVLIEAGLMGRPVVASEIGGIRDVVRHGENGLLVPPGDAMALANAIATILKDRQLATHMGLAGSSIAREYLAGREDALEHVRQAIHGLLNDRAK